jgi:diaminohydroxyphosphoribosylaminopyrimidine deaminase/5-amino-6-(5-phosphoribosylamino)uracil reductase
MDERRLMDEAIRLAAPTSPHPNPRVGALVLDASGVVVGRGSHAGPGLPHAEVTALAEAGDGARGGALIVTLEPCVHTGRTPPCVERIVEAGIARVLVGALDPDRRVDGAGVRRLREAGVEVEVAADPLPAESLDPGYFHHRRTGRPLVTLKAAITLDGEAAAADGTSQWLTSPDARADAHRMRSRADAVMVGAGTVRADAPELSVRLPDYSGPQPTPVVVAGSARLPIDAPVWTRRPIVLAPAPLDVPGEVIALPGPQGVDLEAGLAALGERGIVDLLVEGGPRLAASLLRADLIDRGVFYLAGSLAGGAGTGPFSGAFATAAEIRPVRIVEAERIGPDLRVSFIVEEE